MDGNIEDLILLDEQALNAVKAISSRRFSVLLNYYLEDGRSYVERIEYGLKTNDINVIVPPAHSLKSSSAQLGAMRLSKIAENIETYARKERNGSCNLTPIAGSIEMLRKTFEETEVQIRKIYEQE